MTCWSAFANKNQESRQFLTCGVTGAEVITNVLFRGASSLQYLTICKISRTLNICIVDGGFIRTLVVWCVAGIEAVMFIAELVLWGIRWGVANQTCGWKQNQERLISCFMFQHISLSYQGWSIAGVTKRLFSPSVSVSVCTMQWAAWRNHNWQWHQHQISASAPAQHQHQQHGVALIVELRPPRPVTALKHQLSCPGGSK